MKMENWHEVWTQASNKRLAIDPKTICNFGIKPLDDALIGIMKKDFVVIGADSGAGKTGVCLKIALHNAMQGKKVAIYSIEGGADEAIYRMQWDMIINKYYDNKKTGVEMDYRKWRMNMIQDTLPRTLEGECLDELYGKIQDNLKLYTFDSTFTINDLIESLEYFLKPTGDVEDLLNYKHDVDLIIIDHLQYFTLLNPKDELNEVSNILKKINEITHHHEIPVVLVSHLRKKEKDRGLPSQEDFFGTSNIAKMASVVITLAGSAQDKDKPYTYPTFFRFAKTRTRINPNLGLLCDFDLLTGKYSEKYSVYSLYMDKPQGEALRNFELPQWAKGART